MSPLVKQLLGWCVVNQNSLQGEPYLDRSVDPSWLLSFLPSLVLGLRAIGDRERGYKDLIIDFKRHTRIRFIKLQQKKHHFEGFQCSFPLFFGPLLVVMCLTFLWCCISQTKGLFTILIINMWVQNVGRIEVMDYTWHGSVQLRPPPNNSLVAKSMQVFNIMLYGLWPLSKR